MAAEWLPELELVVPASLPTDHVPEPEVRLEIYERQAKLAEGSAIDELAEEVDDRFGDLPAPAANLLAAAHLRLRCREQGVARLEAGPKAAAATLRDGSTGPAPEALRHSGERLVLERGTACAERIAAAPDLLESLQIANAARRSDTGLCAP